MVTVALIGKDGRPTPVERWDKFDERIAKKTAGLVLRGVGDDSTDKRDTNTTITLAIRRQCTDDERRKVLEKYTRMV